MVVDPMWAGQYLLLDELWRGRERIVFDPLLNQLILAPGGDELAWDKEGRVHSLLESLLAQDSAGVWLLFENLHRVARAGVDPTMFGARALHDGPLLALRRHWEVAMVDVTRLLDSMSASRGTDSSLSASLAPEASLVDALLSSVESDRSLVLWTKADAREPRDSARLSALFRLFQTARGGQDPQLMGMSRAPVLQAFPLGGASHADVQGVDVDNRLGTDYPDFRYYMAVLGPKIPAGVTLLELPASEHDGAKASAGQAPRKSPERRTLRDRLDYVEQELEASERSRLELLRDLDHATSQVAELEDELDDLRDPPGVAESSNEREPAVSEAPADEVATQALLLHASWEIEQLRAQLTELRARPVEEIEAENARLKAALRSLSSPASVQKMMSEQGAEQTLAIHSKGLALAGNELSIPTQTGPSPKKKEGPEEPSDDEPAVPKGQTGESSGLWSPDLVKSQLTRVQSSTTAPRDWQPELLAIASALRGLRNRIERGDLKPLPLQAKLRELERGVERILREGRSSDFGRPGDNAALVLENR